MDNALDVKIEAKEGYLLVQVTGEYRQEHVMDLIEKIGKRAKQERLMSVLADFRGLTGKLDITDLHTFGELLPRKFPPGCSIALVIADPADEDHRFLETVARNRGAQLHRFGKIEDAEEWLMSSSANPTAGRGKR